MATRSPDYMIPIFHNQLHWLVDSTKSQLAELRSSLDAGEDEYTEDEYQELLELVTYLETL